MTWTSTKTVVLVPYDFSSPSAAGLEAARNFVADPSHVVALNVIEPKPHISTLSDVGAHERQEEVAETRQRLAAELAKRGFGTYQSSVRVGPAAKTIVDEAERLGAELIVIPSHGRTGVERWFLGSVTEHVVRHADCPVLVLGREAHVP
jgi:nucleotide-binding universal stress UspA family protein